MRRPLRITTVFLFATEDGEPRRLKEPFAPATARQLRLLNKLGALMVVEPGPQPSLTVGEAAYAIDEVLRQLGTAAP